eukprot:TRINITY_DN3792_c0_g2_i1.p2 TRINITY_DN3792_c0_g2~~TRINITY_DN3792_c0_g2_i1.p2  ORF type:complete len:224 (+),score=28.76 TRINITY_DN3792_c0_g2_i1:199-870(+)
MFPTAASIKTNGDISIERSAILARSMFGKRNYSVASTVNESTLKVNNEIKQKFSEYCRLEVSTGTDSKLSITPTPEPLSARLKRQGHKIRSLLAAKQHLTITPSAKLTGSSSHINPFYSKINCRAQPLPLLVNIFAKDGLTRSWLCLSFARERPDRVNCEKAVKLEKPSVSLMFTDSKAWTGEFEQDWIYLSVVTKASCSFEIVCRFGKRRLFLNCSKKGGRV